MRTRRARHSANFMCCLSLHYGSFSTSIYSPPRTGGRSPRRHLLHRAACSGRGEVRGRPRLVDDGLSGWRIMQRVSLPIPTTELDVPVGRIPNPHARHLFWIGRIYDKLKCTGISGLYFVVPFARDVPSSLKSSPQLEARSLRVKRPVDPFSYLLNLRMFVRDSRRVLGAIDGPGRFPNPSEIDHGSPVNDSEYPDKEHRFAGLDQPDDCNCR